jgi:acyl-coenzyme A synthetase/AMP-(fatty) acid ligase
MQAQAGSNLLHGWIARAAARTPEKPWLIGADDGHTVSYRALHEAAGRFAAFLAARGLGRNDRVALLANNSVEQLLTYFGVMAAGVTVCTVHVEMNRNQLGNIFERLKPRLILYQDGLALDDLLAGAATPKIRLGRWNEPAADTLFGELLRYSPSEPPPRAGERREGAGPEDDAVILFTSGTSARPKGVVLNFREYLLNIDAVADGFAIDASDRIYDSRPFSWASAQLLGALCTVNRGATLVMAEKFSASRFFTHLRAHDVTIAAGNPTIINILLNGEAAAHRTPPPKLRFITSSSAPLMLNDWVRFEQKFGVPIAQGCGSSETSWIAAIPGEQRRLGTVGRPLRYHDLAIVDAEGKRLPTGEIGYVELGGFPDHPYRYLAEDGSIEVHSRGRIRTGDLGCLDTDGFLTLTGREKELIIRGGAKISPVEIDACLMQHADVIEAATIGVPDPIYGEEVVSYIVTRPGKTPDAGDLLRYCGALLPAFKAPKRIVLADALPKTERGKLDRKALLEQWRKAPVSS